jgi:putative FmdB family regulatory protein
MEVQMPIYEYECEKCLLRFELKRPYGEDGRTPCPQCTSEARRLFSPVPIMRPYGEDGRTPCPQCTSEARRLFSPVPIIFKGSGFYSTDNRKHNLSNEDQ